MRIWVIGRGYPSTVNHMLGSFELEQAQMFAKYGNEVYYPVVDLRSVRHRRKWGLSLAQQQGVTIATFSFPVGRIVPMKWQILLKRHFREVLLRKLGRRTGKPDIIHVHYPSIYPYKLFSGFQKEGAKIIGTEHWSKVQNHSLPPHCVLNMREFVDQCDAICCVGPQLREAVLKLTGTNKEIHIIPNVVSKMFSPTGQAHLGFRFVAAGRLIPTKQFDLIVKAFVDVFHDQKEVSLSIAGNGTEYDKIHRIILENKAEDQIHMTGEITRQQMAELLGETDVLVVFSSFETFCVPVIEAWSCGKPVISTESTILALNPDPRLGILVDSQDISSLKKAMKDIRNEYDKYNSDFLSDYAQRHFSEEAVYHMLRNVYSIK